MIKLPLYFLPLALAVGILGITGCGTEPEAPSHLTSLPPTVPGSPADPRVAVAEIPPTVATNVEELAAAPASHATISTVESPEEPRSEPLAPPPSNHQWVRLDQWAAKHGFASVQRTHQGKDEYYDLRGTPGHLLLKTGSSIAHWNGVELWLGYPVRIIDGRASLDSLDLEKSLGPLFTRTFRLTNSHPTIVIDPGHGGVKAGTKSALYNRYEKDYTLDWGRRLANLMALRGWNVYLTRTNDVDLSLTNRVAVADAVDADLFISLHFNSSYPSTDQMGIETYCMTPAGMPSSLTRGSEEDPPFGLPNNAFDSENLQLAMALHRTLLETTQASDRGVRHARFMGVLKRQRRPSVLIEAGYLSSPIEASKIGNATYREQLAVAVARALDKLRPVGDSSVTQK